jgi:hypothetical protein
MQLTSFKSLHLALPNANMGLTIYSYLKKIFSLEDDFLEVRLFIFVWLIHVIAALSSRPTSSRNIAI